MIESGSVRSVTYMSRENPLSPNDSSRSTVNLRRSFSGSASAIGFSTPTMKSLDSLTKKHIPKGNPSPTKFNFSNAGSGGISNLED